MFISKTAPAHRKHPGRTTGKTHAVLSLAVVAGFVGVAAIAPLAVTPSAQAEDYAPLARGSVMNQQLMAAATEASGYTMETYEVEDLPEPEPEPTPTATPGTSPTGAAQAAPVAAAAPPAGIPDPGSAQSIARGYVGNDSEFNCLVSLWNRESGWNVNAYNASSGATGIPQALPGNKMASAGADWATNPDTQIRWGLGYIQGRYGSPCGAWAHSEAVGWY